MEHTQTAKEGLTPSGSRELDRSTLLGVWSNTNRDTQGISKLEIATRDGALSIRAYGRGRDGLIDWGEGKHVTTYAGSPDAGIGSAFIATFDLGFMEAILEGNVNRGVLVLGCYSRFLDGSGRRPYFSREFYYRL